MIVCGDVVSDITAILFNENNECLVVGTPFNGTMIYKSDMKTINI